jgi:hypothetical protein
MAGRSKKNKASKQAEEEFRADGYQTITEFIDKFTLGLREYMYKNWPNPNPHILNHPEDLASSALTYAEAVHTTIQTFGAGNTNIEE